MFRSIGFILLACAVLFAVIDGTKSLSASQLVVTSSRDSWNAVAPGTLAGTQAAIEAYTPSFVWNKLILTILAIPTFLVLGVLALILMTLGKARRHAYI